ncbi:MAG: hypothetical protein A2328_09370 [Bdellovibrionales bacterium RIFOXYB2_FULL_36_6]|nr:MAG: hypothetical protein A2328_09370 [Bdellovibrionales bacterium RIFOXYB2_FULL_36_6]
MTNHLDMLKDGQKIKMEGHELLKFKFAPGNVFWIKKNNKLVRILKTGDYMDRDILYKYMNKCAPLVLERLINVKWIEEAFEHFMDLKHAKNLNEQIEARAKILKIIGPVYWHGINEGSLIDLIHLGEKVFFKLPEKEIRQLYQGEMDFFKMNALAGMVSVLFSLTVGYMDFAFLADIYHVGFFVDYSLIEEKIDWTMKEAVLLEVKMPGDGIKKLSLQTGKNDVGCFVSHPEQSYIRVKEKINNLFNSKDCLRLLTKHHEALNGAGFPNGIGENQLSDLETIIISSSRCCQLDHDLVLGDGKGFFKDIRKFISNRISVALKSCFEYQGENDSAKVA